MRKNYLSRILLLSICLITLLGANEVYATDYYINPSTGVDNEYTHGTSVSTPWKTMSFAANKIPAGDHVLYLSAGVHQASGAWFNPGIDFIGAGIDITTITGTGDMLVIRSENETQGDHYIANMTFDGQNSELAKGIWSKGRNNIHIENVKFFECRGTGIWMFASTSVSEFNEPPFYLKDIEINNCEFVNSATGYSWGSGGSAMIGGVDGMLFHDNNILCEFGTNGYGLKFLASGHWKNCKIYNNDIETAEVVGGPWPGEGFAIEVFNLRGGNEIYNNYVNGPISMIAGADRGASDYTVRIHHNVYHSPDGKPAFAIECTGQYIHIDNNLFINPGREGIAIWPGGAEFMPAARGHHKIHNNVFTTTDLNLKQAGISMNVWYNQGQAVTLDDVEIYNNTFYNIRRAIFFNAAAQSGNMIENILIKNNIFHTTDQTVYGFCCNPGNQDYFGLIQFESNMYYNTPVVQTNWSDPPSASNLVKINEIFNVNPNLSLTGDPENDWQNYYALTATSPAIDAGVNVTLPYGGATQGTARDMGAIESPYSVSQTSPSPPSGLTANAQTDPTRVNLNWSDNADNEFGFKIERRLVGGNFLEVATVGSNLTSYTDQNGLQPETAFEYRVQAFNNSGTSAYSNVVSVTTPACQSANLASPSGLNASAASEEAITVSWNAYSHSRFTGYNLYRATSASGTYTKVNSSLLSSTSFTDAGLLASTTYYYQIVAVDDCPTEGALSTPVSASTLSQNPYPGPSPHPVPGVILAENFDEGGNGVAYYDESAGNSGGSSYRNSDVDIWDGGTSDRVIGWIVTGEWLEYTIEAFTAGDYDVIINASNPNAGKVSIWIDGSDVSGVVSLAGTGAYSNYVDNNVATVTLTTGVHVLRVQMEDVNFNFNSVELDNGVVINPPAAPSGLTSTTMSASQIQLDWTDNSNDEQGFKIERKVGAGTYSEVATVGANVITYLDGNLIPSSTYTYRVVAYNAGGNSAYSNEVSATTQAGVIAVSGVTVTPSVISIEAGFTQQLTTAISPSNASDQTVNWNSGNTAIATVDTNGLVTAVSIGSTTITVTTTDGGYTANSAVTVIVPTQSPFGGTPIAVPGVVEAENFDEGGEGVAYHDTDGTSQGNTSYRTAGVDIWEYSTGDYSIGWILAGEWLEYTINVASLGDYDFDILTSNVNGNGALRILIDGVDVTGLVVLAPTSGNGDYVNNTVSAVALTAGTHIMRVVMEVDAFNFKSVAITGGSADVPVTGVSVSPTSTSIVVGNTTALNVTVSPANATDASVSWSSSNTAVATVSSTGVVTGVADGTALITVTTNDGGYTASTSVTVSTPSSGPCTTPALLDNSAWSITASLEGCSSSTDASKSIDGNFGTRYKSCGGQTPGMYLEIDMGQVNTLTSIELTSLSNRLAAGYDIQVSVDGSSYVSVAGSSSPIESMTLAINQAVARYVKVINTGDNGVDWVMFEMELSGCDGGSTTTVNVTGVSLASNLSLETGSTGQLTASVSPSNATDQSISYSSGNASVATVDANGLVTAITAGTTSITVTTNDGSFTDNVTITVNDPAPVAVTGVTLASDLTLVEGTTGQLTATVSPVDADDQTVSYASTNVSFATVDANGVVTAIAAGTATITVTTTDGGFTDSVFITVTALPSGNCSTPLLLDNTGWSITASLAGCSSSTDASKAIDGSLGTRYKSCGGQTPGMYLEIDMGQVNTLTSIELTSLSNRLAAGYDIQVSSDGNNYVSVASSSSPIENMTFAINEVVAQYVKIINTGDNGVDWVMFEVELSGCDGGSSARISGSSISIEEFHEEQAIQIYPNPVREMLNINSNESIDQINLFNLSGQNVIVPFDGISLDVSQVKPGIYFLRLIISGQSIEKKIIIE